MEDRFSVFVNGDVAETKLAQDSHRAVAVGTDMCGKMCVGCEGDDFAADLAVPTEERFDRVIGDTLIGYTHRCGIEFKSYTAFHEDTEHGTEAFFPVPHVKGDILTQQVAERIRRMGDNIDAFGVNENIVCVKIFIKDRTALICSQLSVIAGNEIRLSGNIMDRTENDIIRICGDGRLDFVRFQIRLSVFDAECDL